MIGLKGARKVGNEAMDDPMLDRFSGISTEEFVDLVRDDVAVVFECEVTRVQKMKFCVREVAQKCLCTFDGEEAVILAPHDQRPRLFHTEVAVPIVIDRHVGRVVVEEVELDGIIAGSVEEVLIEGIGIRADRRNVCHAVRVLKDGRAGRHEAANGHLCLGISISKVYWNWSTGGVAL